MARQYNPEYEKNRKPNTKCCICNKPKYRAPWRLKISNVVYCRECNSKYNKNNPKTYENMVKQQKLHPYKLGKHNSIQHRINCSIGLGGNGDIFNPQKTQQLRKLVEYKVWRLSVFIRDNFTCVNCKNVGGKLNAHHLKSFAKYPETRFDIKNGVTLCKKCHKEVHKNESL